MKKQLKFWMINALLSVGALTVHAGEVMFFWTGAVTEQSGEVVMKSEGGVQQVRLVWSTQNDLSNPNYSAYFTPDAATQLVKISALNLQPNTRYYFGFELDGTVDSSPEDQGSFTTFSLQPYSYKAVVGSCSFLPNNRVYDAMRNKQGLFYLNSGDMHYADPSSTNVQPHRDAYETRVLTQDREKLLFQHVPVAYVWDDHDFCGNNNDGQGGCGAVAKQAYMEYVPHYPLGDTISSTAIYQSFTVGRIRYIMSDLRSERGNGHIMSETQKNWLKNEMLAAKAQGQLIAWVSSVSFSGTGSDNWGAFSADRTELGNFFRDSEIENMMIISGDAHMLAIDNGTHADFSDNSANPYLYPIFQAAALNNFGSDKGGTYSEGGTYPNPLTFAQYGTLEVIDSGGSEICITMKGYRLNTITNTETELLSYTFCRSLPLVNIPETPATQMLVYPNPNHGNFNVDASSLGENLTIQVINYAGASVLNERYKKNPGILKMDFTSLAKGIYFVQIKHQKGVYIQKIIIG